MDVIIYIALIILAIYIFVKFVLPVVGVVAGVILIIGLGYALVLSIYGFIKSLIKNRNPYNTFVDKTKDIPSGLRRSYFFGPGLHQIKITVKDAFAAIKNQYLVLNKIRIK